MECEIRPIALYHGYSPATNFLYGRFEGSVEVCGYIWYVKSPSGKKILVDAGTTAELMSQAGFGGKSDVQSLEEGLGKHGLKPADVDTVVLTHLHHDHVGLASRFINARFIVQRAELDFALDPHPVSAPAYRSELFTGLDFEIIEGDREIAPGLSTVLTPGHTPGCQSVRVETAGGSVVIAGFCSIQKNFDPCEPGYTLPVIAPGIHTDVLQAYDNLLKVKSCAERVIALHDPQYTRVGLIV